MNDFFVNWFYRIAAKGWISPTLFERRLPKAESLPARTGPLHIELVSHCWNYAHLLRYQLSSLVLSPPAKTHVTMTVIYCREDQGTVDLLQEFGRLAISNVTWNWVPVEKTRLFRRAIGRNMRAKATTADWIFFTDCDQMFYRDAFDKLGEELQGRRDYLLFPRVAQCSQRVHDASEVLKETPKRQGVSLVEIDPELFHPVVHHKAVGGLQIVHGDVARAIGYCEALKHFQTPCPGFGNTYEDRSFRWLLGTHGTPIDVPHIYRIEHHQKGRYESRRIPQWLRPVLSNAGRKELLAKLRPQAGETNSRRAA